MRKGIRRAVTAAALILFLFSAAMAGNILYQRSRDAALYEEAQQSYASFREENAEGREAGEGEEKENGENSPENGGSSSEGNSPKGAVGSSTEGKGGPSGETKAYGDSEAGKERAPLVVDFAKLREASGDVQGWIYCEDTPINYPVVKGEDNSFYLEHSYDGKKSSSGAIFLDAANRSGFADANTILYGHHMKNGSMFACLEKWSDQAFYEEHPELWMLTPEGDYRIVLFAGYTTSADSETYTIFTGPCVELDAYLEACVRKSDFQAEIQSYVLNGGAQGANGMTGEIPGADSAAGSVPGEDDMAAEAPGDGRKFVVLSTCAYSFEEARYVLHGMLVPVDTD